MRHHTTPSTFYSLTHLKFTCLTALSTLFYPECVRLTQQYYFIYPRLSKVWSMLHLMPQYFLNWNITLRRFNFTWYKQTTCKQHVRLLSLRCFCMVLLNWDIRLRWLRSFNISDRKIRSNTLRWLRCSIDYYKNEISYYVNFAVVIQLTEKYLWLWSLSCFILQLRHYTTLATLR